MRRFQIILIIVSAFLIFSLIGSVVDLWSRRDILTVRKETLSGLEKEHTALKARLTEVETPAFIEREARERLGMSKPGETVVILDHTVPEGQSTSELYKETLPNWKQWWKIFF